MKHLSTLAVIVISLLNAPFSPAFAGEGSGSLGPVVRRDLVGTDLKPAEKGAMVLMREVRQTANGYEVKVRAANGTLCMKGTYADEQLTLAHGHFSYYHDNGTLESEGRFENGVKTGVWSRFDRDGHAKSEKLYNGQTYEQMVVSRGWNAPQN